jgi:hypothetical protein
MNPTDRNPGLLRALAGQATQRMIVVTAGLFSKNDFVAKLFC